MREAILYVAGATAQANLVAAKLRDVFEQRGGFTLIVVDVTLDPDRAERDGVLATPTLTWDDNGHERRLVGNLSEPSLIDKWFPPEAAA